jgi:ribonuclease Z
MPPLVLPTLVNEGWGDPGLFAPFPYHRHAYLFDIGDIRSLSPRNLLKISHVFVSHTHMDHFIGFDFLLRLVLGRDKSLHLFGPEGFLGHVEGKLAGYSWNLVDNYTNPLILKVTEVAHTHIRERSLACSRKFQPVSEDFRQFAGTPVVLCEDAAHRVRAVILDHGLPCLGFSLEESCRINIRKDGLQRLGLSAGSWLKPFKQAILAGTDPDSQISVPSEKAPSGARTFRFGDLVDELAITSTGQKIAYIADAAYTPANIAAIRRLVDNPDHLFIEAAFLDADRGHAARKKHLTAFQAGYIAGLLDAGRFTLFHFSPRYNDPESSFYREAEEGYRAGRHDREARESG